MRKVPIFTLFAILLLVGGFFFYQHLNSKVDITFTFLANKKLHNQTVTGTIDGAGDKLVTLPLSKQQWKNMKIGTRYNVEVSFYNTEKLTKKARKKLKGPFWSNESNQGLLTNKITVEKIENTETSMD